MKMKRWIGCLCVAMLVLGMSACSKSADEDKSADDGQKTEQVETDQKKDVDLSQVYTLYDTLVQDKKYSVDNYNWQRAVSSDLVTIDRQTALCDINSDGVPELFLMEAVNNHQADLHIYTVKDGETVEMKSDANGSESLLSDVAAGAGVNYVVFTGKDGKFYIYRTSGDSSITYRICTYTVDGITLKQDGMLENEYGPSEDNTNEITDEYSRNGKKITVKLGKKLFHESFQNLDKAILFSGYDETSIWSCFDMDSALSVSSDDMIAQLEKGMDD